MRVIEGENELRLTCSRSASGGIALLRCETQDDIRRMRQLLDGLPARERQIILLRYGLSGQPPLTQLETAKLLDISRSYVSRLETHALELLRQRWDVPSTKTAQR